MLKTVAIISLLILSAISTEAQGIDFRPLNVATGLRNNQVWLMRPLRNKTILIGYPDAFSIFDGTLSHDLDFNPQQYIQLNGFGTIAYEDRQHRLWIKQYKRMFVFDQVRCDFVASPSDLLSGCGIACSDIGDLFFDSDTTAYIYKNDGTLYAYDFKDEAKEVYKLSKRQITARVLPVHVASINGQRLIFFSNGELMCLTSSASVTLLAGGRRNAPFSAVCTLPLDKQNLLIAMPGKGLSVYNSGTQTFTAVVDSLQDYVRLLRDDMENIISVGHTGIRIYDRFLHLQSTVKQPQPGKSFDDRIISDATIDWQGGMWISTFLNGIYYYNIHDDEQQVWSLPDSGQEIRSSVGLPDGNIAYCTADAVYLFDTKTCQYRLLTRQKGRAFYQVCSDSLGTIYVTSNCGVMCFGVDDTKKWLPSVKGRCAVHGGNRLYTNQGGNNFGYIDLATEQYHVMPIPQEIQHQPTDYWSCAVDYYHNRIYLQTSEHLLCFDMTHGKWDILSAIEPAAAGIKTRADQIFCDGKGNTLFAALDGLHILTADHKLLSVNKESGLNNNTVRAICQGSEENDYWVATANGLASITVGKDGKVALRHYAVKGSNDGYEIIGRSLFSQPSGVWFTTSNSIIRFYPKTQYAKQIYAYKPVLASYTVMGREKPLADIVDDKLRLSYANNFFTLTFSACNYMSPEQTIYRYRMEGIDDDWREVSPVNGNLEVSYTNVSPGTRTFEVQVRDESGEWGEVTELAIDIAPPFWRTWWAYTFYFLLFASVVIGGYRVYNMRRDLLARLKDKRNKMLIQADKVKPEEIEIKSQDELFIKKAVTLVEQHLGDSDYNVDALSSDMALNRSHFYRRLHALTGQSPTEFIRTIRLRRAEALLRESGRSVSEVAYECGFNSPVFFRKYFKDLYGVTPSEYKDGKRQ